ncbi:MAG TPA: hypothetical protein VHZ54_19030 [Solirubrobacterales bacterium]|jgi:hypothetical protein|nr:hypothetical protein [Solirubrobacterales bacterium]
MEPARNLKMLWRRRRLVALGGVVALIAAILSVYTVSIFPPSLTSRTNVFATASSQILVDTPDSSFADLSYELEPLETRAAVFARFLANPAAMELVSQQSGIPAYDIEAQGPYEQNLPLNQQQPTAEQRSTQIIGEGALYRLRLENNPDLPIISVFAQAPTEKQAKALAAAAPAALRVYVKRLQEQQHTPKRDRVEIRPLGHATGGVVNAGANREIALLVFFVVFVGWCLLMIPANTIIGGWRDGGGRGGSRGGGEPAPAGAGAANASSNGHGRREDAIHAGLPERMR